MNEDNHWWITKIVNAKKRNQYLDFTSSGYEPYMSDAKRADDEILHCTKCNFCWQFNSQLSRTKHYKNNNIKLYLYYENFPTYGRKKRTCPDCEMKKEKNEK
tara:strand:+ start:214 stop:519 length:306 start_codon:yes stop_codon:yes gene_type:complete